MEKFNAGGVKEVGKTVNGVCSVAGVVGLFFPGVGWGVSAFCAGWGLAAWIDSD